MRRREFLQSAATAAAALAAPSIRPARAQSRSATLLPLSESGPNNLDIIGVGTNRPGYEASWNSYAARFESGPQKYKVEIIGFVSLAFAEVPRIPLFQPYLDVATQKNVSGCRYWFHQQLAKTCNRRQSS
jgi:hypothetical protein